MSVANTTAGSVSAVAQDPSDPSGNTVYIGASTGGIWKTTNFLTTNPSGPTWVPLTQLGPTGSLNIGSIAVFGRNGNPNQSIIVAGTGDGEQSGTTSAIGVGFLLSMDGGATWTLLDSSTNVDGSGVTLPMNSPARDHVFVGMTCYQVVVDPHLSPTGKVIMYAAMFDPTDQNGGIWRSLDSGAHWTKVLAGEATSVVLDPDSGRTNQITNPTENLQNVYAGMETGGPTDTLAGVYSSPNQGTVWSAMLGTGGNPQIQNNDFFPNKVPIPVANPSSFPNSGGGRVILAKPELTGDTTKDLLYEGWLYAAVENVANDTLAGIYVTKNYGLSWTQIQIPNDGMFNGYHLFVPSNNLGKGNLDPTVFQTEGFNQAQQDLAFTVDAANPNVVYLGGIVPYGSAEGQGERSRRSASTLRAFPMPSRSTSARTTTAARFSRARPTR